MLSLMYASRGVGLAASQVGISRQPKGLCDRGGKVSGLKGKTDSASLAAVLLEPAGGYWVVGVKDRNGRIADVGFLKFEEVFLGLAICLESAVPVEMVGGEVCYQGNVRSLANPAELGDLEAAEL